MTWKQLLRGPAEALRKLRAKVSQLAEAALESVLPGGLDASLEPAPLPVRIPRNPGRHVRTARRR